MNTKNYGDTSTGLNPELENALESIFTIDGRGRPAKAKLFLLLLQKYGQGEVLKNVEAISNRKNF